MCESQIRIRERERERKKSHEREQNEREKNEKKWIKEATRKSYIARTSRDRGGVNDRFSMSMYILCID